MSQPASDDTAASTERNPQDDNNTPGRLQLIYICLIIEVIALLVSIAMLYKLGKARKKKNQ